MHSSITNILLTIFISIQSSLVYAGDYPLIGVTLLQSAPQSQAYGTITITQQSEDSPLVVEGIILNVKPNSQFGLHVHEQGDITNACQSTGSHFNPYSKQHGSERSSTRHWGDFGNVVSDGSGTIRVFIVITEGSLIGIDGYFGRGFVFHEREDDLGLTDNENSKTTGNAGNRLACGVIGIRRPTDRLPTPPRMTSDKRPMNFVPIFRQQ